MPHLTALFKAIRLLHAEHCPEKDRHLSSIFLASFE